MKSKKLFCVVFIAAFSCSLLAAQSPRDGVKNTIKQWGTCRSIAFTMISGNIAIAGRNMAAWANIPTDLHQQLLAIANRDNGPYISDVQLTEGGQWVIVGDQIICGNVRQELINEIRRLASAGEVIQTITLNDFGRWIIITNKSFSSSDSNTGSWLSSNKNNLGSLRTACLTADNGLVAVYDKGTVSQGNMPNGLIQALRETNLDVKVIKVSLETWFFADANGNYSGWY